MKLTVFKNCPYLKDKKRGFCKDKSPLTVYSFTDR